MRFLKQSTSVDLPIGPFVDSTDGFTEEGGLTLTQPDIRLKKNGAAWAQKNAAQTLSHEENGYYEVTLDATDTDTLGQLLLAVDETGALPVWHEFMVMPANVWDSLFGADLLQVDSTQLLGTGYATPTVAGVQEVDVTHLGGAAQSATDLKDFADDGYDPATNKVQGVVLTDTVTTYTGNTVQTGDSFARIGATGSGLTSLASQASVTTIDDFLDTEIAAIKAVTDLLPNAGALTTIQSDLDNIQTRLPAALVSGRMDSSVGAMATDTLTADALAADAVAEIAASIAGSSLATGTADSGTATTVVDAARTEADTDYWKGEIIVFTTGTLAGQCRLITGFVPGTDTITFAPATTQAVSTHGYEIRAWARADVELWDGAAVNALVSGRVDSSVGAMATDTLTAAALASDAVTEVQSGLATAAALTTIDDFLDTEIAAIKAVTDALPNAGALTTIQADLDNIQGRLPTSLVSGRMDSSVGAMASDTMTAAALAADAGTEIADAILKRDMSAVTGEAARSMLNALRFLRNKWAIAAGTLTVRKEDDTTSAWTAALTTDPSAEPIVTSDPT